MTWPEPREGMQFNARVAGAGLTLVEDVPGDCGPGVFSTFEFIDGEWREVACFRGSR